MKSLLWLQLALQFITQHGPWEWGGWNSEHLPSLWNQQRCVVALPGTVLAEVKSLFSCPLPFPSFHPGLLPAEIEPMQTGPWPRPAACSGCLPRGAAGPHYEAAVSITKKEKSQLSMELRTRTFASSGMQIADAWPNWSSWWKTCLSKKTFLNPRGCFFSVAANLVLKCWDVCDRQVSGMQLLEEKNMPVACSPHTYLFL